MKKKKLKIALIGTRGVPANYGGFETCVEEVGKRLADMGHKVTVYCRKSYYKEQKKEHFGMRLVYLPNIRKKSLDTISHTFLSVWHALFQNYDVYMVFNAANSLLLAPLLMAGKRVAINTDGLEWKRSKWGYVGRSYYKLTEKIACAIANRVVADSRGIQDYYKKTHGCKSTEIAYGAPVQTCQSCTRLGKMGLEPFKYFLQITRFEPENYPLLTIQAYNKLHTDKKLVLVGGNPYPNGYTRAIEQAANGNVILPGSIYDRKILRELWCNCYAYIHGNSVGGTNPALLQTMASGCFTLANDISFNRDVLAECGLFYKPDAASLAAKMQWALENESQLDIYRIKAQKRVQTHYTWDKIAAQYEGLFWDLVQGKYPRRWWRGSHSLRPWPLFVKGSQ